MRLLIAALVPLSACAALRDDVTIRRDTYGVPHILARSEKAAAFGLGYAQAEDHAIDIARVWVAARGRSHEAYGGSIDADFRVLQFHNPEAATEQYRKLPGGYRGIVDAFVAGVNHYIIQNRAKLPAWIPAFTGVDAIAHSRSFGLGAAAQLPAEGEDGSNAFALHGSRTVSGKPILLGNPHLQWSSLYWEAHITVPGKLNFYGSTLPGIPVLRAGFNERLGWVTTNNAPDLVDVFEAPLDPERPGRYLWNGKSMPLREHKVRIGAVERVFHDTHAGPVLRMTKDRILTVRSVALESPRYFETFYRMAKAKNLREFRKVLDKRLSPTSNFTYADADGNIYYHWNARIPKRVDDGTDYRKPVAAKYSWKSYHKARDLPTMLNPRGGYIMNSNDAPWYTNLEQPLDPARYPGYFERGELRLRSQVILSLLRNDRKFSQQEVTALKYTNRVLLADRIKADLIEVLRNDPAMARAAAVLEAWDNQVNASSRGAVLFVAFAQKYLAAAKKPFATPWDAAHPDTTPRGLGDPDAARQAMREAMTQAPLDAAWGDVYRFRVGATDLPGDGAMGTYGVYRVMGFNAKKSASFGDAWILNVEFTQPVQAYSVLAYGQTTDATSKHCCDQIRMFANHQLRKVWFTEEEIQANLERSYKP